MRKIILGLGFPKDTDLLNPKNIGSDEGPHESEDEEWDEERMGSTPGRVSLYIDGTVVLPGEKRKIESFESKETTQVSSIFDTNRESSPPHPPFLSR